MLLRCESLEPPMSHRVKSSPAAAHAAAVLLREIKPAESLF
jgi:hypothetical protein